MPPQSLTSNKETRKMKILLLGEASFVHATLKAGLEALGHEVTVASSGNSWHDAPRDIDLRRDMRLGMAGGIAVLWRLARSRRRLSGCDIVQIHSYAPLPLGMRWNMRLLRLLKRHNRCLVKLCLGDDPQVFKSQMAGTPAYSDTFWGGRRQNTRENGARLAEQRLPGVKACWREATRLAERLVACLYEYYLNYDTPPFGGKLCYIPLPIEIPAERDIRVKGRGKTIDILVGIQADRDYMKGARRIAAMLETLSRRNPGRLRIHYAENVPYGEYCRMLCRADVLADQLYSYTPSMNSLAAMARGTVVIGGGEEDFYRFIGEKELRPIINVRPDVPDEENIRALAGALLTPGRIAEMSRQSVEFVRKYHDHRLVARQYERLYESLLAEKGRR